MDNFSQPTTPTPAADLPAEVPVDLSGKTLDDFRLIRRLGQGGMGQVYLAEQLSLKRKVALKIMRADLGANPTALTRFKKEAEAAARVTHANIVQVYAIGCAAGQHYMALEYVEGRTLRDFIAKKGPPELPLALSIMRQAAAALQEAHEAGIIHRDIKPENILLTRKGEVKVADFGLSRCFGGDQQPLHLTQSGVSMGTPLYMSPEQVQGREVDPRTDLYSFGVTCYHMLAGQPPFRGQSAFDLALQHVQNEPTPLAQLRPDLPAELCAVIAKLMTKDPGKRYQSSGDLLADLGRLRDGIGVAAGESVGLGLLPAQGFGPNSTMIAPVTSLRPTGTRRAGALVALVAGSLLVAGAVGAGMRLWRGPAVAEVAPATEPATAKEAVRLGPPSREAALQAAVKKEVSVREPDEFRRHLEATAQLGVLYLEQRRLNEADAFFKDLREKPPAELKVYSALGRIGHAAVLAYQDKPEESNKLFLEIAKSVPTIGEKGRPGGADWRQLMGRGPRDAGAEMFLMMFQPAVRRIVAEALSCNAANMTEPLPPELERLRKLPTPPARPAGAGIPPVGPKAGS
jgi:serine/threonine-protein kinase